MRDDDLRNALRSLPTASPGPGFVDEVMARVRASETGGPPVGRRLAWAAVLVIGFGTGTWWAIEEHSERRRSTEIQSLQQESDRLEAEIARVREQLREPAPLIYLGGTERVDVVLDLETLERTGRGRGAMRPASSTGRPVVRRQ